VVSDERKYNETTKKSLDITKFIHIQKRLFWVNCNRMRIHIKIHKSFKYLQPRKNIL